MKWTAEQRAIIDHTGRHAIVTAVAGSGKTSTLVAHVLQQLTRGHDPRRMLVLMFNRSAREDFEHKLARAMTTPVTLPIIRTYHSMGLRLYQNFAQGGHLPPVQGEPLAGIPLELACWKILAQIAPASLQESLKTNKSAWISDTVGFIELVKSTIRTPEQVFAEYGFHKTQRLLLDVYHAFETWRLEQGLITYADMLYQPVMAMIANPALVDQVSNRMDLMLVDEYQDTNEVQHTLLKMIAGTRASVMVVGDPDQTIYEFRGARPEYILRTFAEDFPDPVHYTLSYTFRYGHRLALLADHLIDNNQQRGDTLCIAHRSTPNTAIHCVRDSDHAQWLVKTVQELSDKGRPLSDIVILVRLWSQTVTLELALLEQQIPFTSAGEKSAFDRQEIQLLLSLVQLAAQQFAELSDQQRYQHLWQLLRFPHVGIADQRLKPLCQQLSKRTQGFGQWLIAKAQTALPGLSDFQKTRLLERGRLLQQVETGKGRVEQLLQRYIADSELKRWLKDSALDSQRAEEQCLVLESFCRYLTNATFDATQAHAHITELQERQRQNRVNQRRAGKNGTGHKPVEAGITLTSMHKSKGLEWPVVILPSLVDKQIPCAMGDKPLDNSALESERRLLYVAMTRAREQLFLVTTKRPSALVESDRMPSRFIGELHEQLSIQVGAALHDLPAETSDGEQDRVISLDSTSTDVVTRYLATEYPRVRVQQGTMTSTLDTIFALPWAQERVSHAILGAGAVLSETATDFKVRFDDGSTRDFCKQTAHLYFS